MHSVKYLAFAFLAIMELTCGPAAAANICEAGRLRCATTMPVDGYCECTAHGATEGGTVVGRREARQPPNSTAAGCGAQPNAPGCR